MHNVLDVFAPEIRDAARRHVRRKADWEDAMQEGRLAVWQHQPATAEEAYKLAKNAIRRYLFGISRERLFSDLDKEPVGEQQECGAAGVLEALGKLPASEQIVIRSLFGLAGERKTVRELGFLLNRSRSWIIKKKRMGLAKLKIMLEARR